MSERTSLLIRCSKEEAEIIRRAARAERRTISGFVINAVLGRLQARAKILPKEGSARTPAALGRTADSSLRSE